MNMPIADMNSRKFQDEQFIGPNAVNVVSMRKQIDSNVLARFKESYKMLDQHFALQNGSHKDVKQYIVYFNHIMAFFADGSHCGLQQSKQFVAFLGCKESPESIVLKDNNVHVELVLNEMPTRTLRFPAQGTFNAAAGDDYCLE